MADTFILEHLFQLHDTILQEGRGLAAREAGEVWRDKEGHEIVFEQTILVPKDGAMKDLAALEKVIQQTLDRGRITLIKKVNTSNAAMLACMVAVFTDATAFLVVQENPFSKKFQYSPLI
jgi:hypothetical protein